MFLFLILLGAQLTEAELSVDTVYCLYASLSRTGPNVEKDKLKNHKKK